MTSDPQQEELDGQLLVDMMGGAADPEVALRVLRKHKGDVQKAAEAMLNGDTGEEPEAWNSTGTQSQGFDFQMMRPAPSIFQPPASNLIDLTGDDDDYTRIVETKFGPSNRAPDPAWQVVRSNEPAAISQDEQTLKDAIQASLNDINSYDTEEIPKEESVREGGRPVACRTDDPGLAYAALVIQCLFHVPQFRERISKLHMSRIEDDSPLNSPDYSLSHLMDVCVNFELAQLSCIVENHLFTSLDAKPWTGPSQQPGQLSQDFLLTLLIMLSHHFTVQDVDQGPFPLFKFTHTSVPNPFTQLTSVPLEPDTGGVVTLNLGTGYPPDLISCLSELLTHHPGKIDVIIQPSEIVMFHLIRKDGVMANASFPDTFVYPKSIYMDRFLIENVELWSQKRAQQGEMRAELQRLTLKRDALTRFDGKDTLKDLRTTIYYFEHVAQVHTPERRAVVESMLAKLTKAAATLEAEVEAIDQNITKLQADLDSLFDCPELQKHKYDLRAVLVHTGLQGRKQLYSYVQDRSGIWWKTVDYSVTEVPEDLVLSDPAGLHLGAGPYMVIYSRSLSSEQINAPVVWPKLYVDRTELNNRKFFAALPPELARKADVLPSDSTLERRAMGIKPAQEGSAMDLGSG